MSEPIPDRIRRRYLHAASRLRQRYGVDVSIERYMELCEQLAAGLGEGRRTNLLGDVEAWVEVQPDVWACAVLKASDGLIATFMPAPPPRDLADSPTIARLKEQLAEAQGHARTNGALVKELKARIKAELRDERAALAEAKRLAHEHAQAAAQAAANRHIAEDRGLKQRRDVEWIQRQCQRACSLLAQGKITEAACLLSALAALPASVRPSVDPGAARKLLEAMVERRRAFLAGGEEAA